MTISIPLTKGYVAIVSDEDADLAELKWTAQEVKSNRAYAHRSIWIDGKKTRFYLHRIIGERLFKTALNNGALIDHWNNNPLDNTRSNLRLATHGENIRNAKKPTTNTSGFKGVHLDKRSRKWIAQIWVKPNHIRLGAFSTPEEAHKAYCEAAVKYYGEFARFE